MDLADSYSEFSDSSSDQEAIELPVRPHGIQTYRDVHNEFYIWEQKYARDVIDSLESKSYPLPADSGDEFDFDGMLVDESSQDAHDSDDMVVENETSSSGPSVIVWDYDESGPIASSAEVSFWETTVEHFPGYPKYEACTPTSRNVNGDPFLNEMASFVPYADDMKFDVVKYLDSFPSFRWQVDFKDPDGKRLISSSASSSPDMIFQSRDHPG